MSIEHEVKDNTNHEYIKTLQICELSWIKDFFMAEKEGHSQGLQSFKRTFSFHQPQSRLRQLPVKLSVIIMEHWLGVDLVTSNLWRHWKIAGTKQHNKNRNIALQEIAGIDHSNNCTVSMATALLLAAWHWLTAAHAWSVTKYHLKTLYFLPTSYLLVNINWSVIICWHCFLSSMNQTSTKNRAS